MRNPLFKAQVKAAFEKTAWPYDPAEIAAEAPGHLRPDIQRGQGLIDTLGHTVKHTVPEIAHDVGRVTNTLLAPATTIGKPVLKGLGHLGSAVAKSPRLLRAGVGTALAAPALYNAFDDSQKAYEGELMAMNRDPNRVLVACELDAFLEKQAELTARCGRVKEADWSGALSDLVHGPTPYATKNKVPMYGPTTPQSAVLGTIAGGVGKALVESALGALGSGIAALKDYFITDPKKAALLKGLLETDSILHDAITRDPKKREMVLEAYGTMNRFAPTLASDVNAVRSFLREAVLGGSGVNYATIKNLVDTERATKVPSHKKD